MDNILSSNKEEQTVNDPTMSALYYARHSVGYTRFFYAAYTLLGVIFYGIGIFTFLGFAMNVINGGQLLSLETVVLSCYILLNSLVGYGFIFHRKWLVTVFTIQALFMGGMSVILYGNGAAMHAQALVSIVFVTIGILTLLYFTRHFLSERYVPAQVIIPFFVTLLLSFLLTNSSMLH